MVVLGQVSMKLVCMEWTHPSSRCILKNVPDDAIVVEGVGSEMGKELCV
jgi:hypothetical protein